MPFLYSIDRLWSSLALYHAFVCYSVYPATYKSVSQSVSGNGVYYRELCSTNHNKHNTALEHTRTAAKRLPVAHHDGIPPNGIITTNAKLQLLHFLSMEFPLRKI